MNASKTNSLKRILITGVTYLLSSQLIYSQATVSSDTFRKKPDLTIFIIYQQGKVLMTNDFVEGINQNHIPIKTFHAAGLQLSHQTTGDKLWEQLYRFPQYGFGFYTSKFINSAETGQPVTIFGSIKFPQHRWGDLALNLYFGIGFAFNWKSFSDNEYNIALGAHQSAHIEAGPSLEYSFSNGLLLDFGTSFTHFSNGALKKPNFGINTFAPKICLGYNFSGSRKTFRYQGVPEFQKKSEIFTSFFTAWENEIYETYESSGSDTLTTYYGETYPVYGLSATFSRQISYRSKFGLGLMIDYFGAANPYVSIENGKLIEYKAPFREGLELSIFPSYELVINRLSIIAQYGYYLYREKYSFLRPPSKYQRLGFKYDVYKNLTAGANLRFYNYNVSHYIEWTLGYRFHL